MVQINFAFLCEGTSDEPLLSLIRLLIIEAGGTRVAGEVVALPGSVRDKLRVLNSAATNYDLIFVHRDADSRDCEDRHLEISTAAGEIDSACPVIGVVPVQTTEAWLLTSEQQIREVAGRSRGREDLGLPRIPAIERLADPKSVLKAAYLAATASTGRRRGAAERLFVQRRATLLERLDPKGAVSELPSFRRLKEDIGDAVASMGL